MQAAQEQEQQLSEEQSRAAQALARGETQEEAGALAGVTGRTIRNWLKQREFRREVGEALSETARRGRRLAFKSLLHQLESGTPEQRLRAADLLLKHTAPEGEAEAQPEQAGQFEVVISPIRIVEADRKQLREISKRAFGLGEPAPAEEEAAPQDIVGYPL